MEHPTIDVYLPVLVKTSTKKKRGSSGKWKSILSCRSSKWCSVKKLELQKGRTKEHMIEQIMNAYQQKLGIKGGNP